MPRRSSLRTLARSIMVYAILLIVVFVIAFPYLYMLSMSLMTDQESVAMPALLLPARPQWHNYAVAFQRVHGLRAYVNTLVVAVGVTGVVLFTSSLAGFGFAKYTFRGRDLLFTAVLATMTIPLFINIIPWYWMIQRLGIDNRLAGVMFPSLASAFGVFMMRQFMIDLPDELLDAARIDGASEFTIYHNIVLPLCPPVLATLGAFTFLYHWNDLLWPLIVLKDRPRWTINLVVTSLQGYGGTGRQLEIAAASMAVVPVLILVICLQRYIVQSIAMTGLKG